MMDPDGNAPRVYTEIQFLGHTFISVGEKGNFTIYTYGRYLGGGKGKSVGGATDPIGKGCMIRLVGHDAEAYIKHEKEEMHAKTFIITDISDEMVSEYFEKIYSNGRILTTEESEYYDKNKNNFGSSSDVRVIDEYSLFSNNCTTKVNDGLIELGSKVYDDEEDIPYNPWNPIGSGKQRTREHIISPLGTQIYLENKSNQENTSVKMETE